MDTDAANCVLNIPPADVLRLRLAWLYMETDLTRSLLKLAMRKEREIDRIKRLPKGTAE